MRKVARARIWTERTLHYVTSIGQSLEARRALVGQELFRIEQRRRSLVVGA